MSKVKILLAEDDVTMVSLLKTLLKLEGFEVTSLQADDDVVETVKKETPSVLILDFHLGSQNGLDILEALRKHQETKQVRIIMSSGANVKEECMNRGANGFLMKPYMPDDLIDLIKENIGE